MSGIVKSVQKAVFGEPPKVDSNVNRSTLRNSRIAGKMRGVGLTELTNAKQRAKAFDTEATEAMGLQKDMAADAAARADSLWERYSEEYIPVEQRMREDAMSWDSPEALERAAQEASTDVTRSFGLSRDINERNMERMGVNPASGRYVANDRASGLEEAAARAGAMNTARDARRMQGVAMRDNVARFGRDLPGMAVGLDSLSRAAAGDALNTANAKMVSRSTAVNQAALPWLQSAANANAGVGSLALGATDAKMKGWATTAEMTGDIIGDVAMGIGYAKSSEEVKEDKEPVNAALVLEGLEEIPVEAWNYKAGEGDGRRHLGPYAEDVRAQFGDAAAPGGEMLDLVTMNGLALSGIQALAKKVRKLEKMGLDTVGHRAKRDTEPRRVA